MSVTIPTSTVDIKSDATNGDDPMMMIDDDARVEATLFRLTSGLPKRELRLMVQEATECEALLLEDIRILEQALRDGDVTGGGGDGTGNEDGETALSAILESSLTPLDRYWTASALLGRLRHEMALQPLLLATSASNSTGNNNKASAPMLSAAEEEKSYQELATVTNPLAKFYSQEIIPVAALLAVWKKISSNRAALVFKRPVRSEEAPGYTERILFPMDLSLIRKRIVANDIQTFADLHAALGLISHNCVKYNGRETDYGRVAREFEAMADTLILQAVRQTAANPQATAEPGASGATAAADLPQSSVATLPTFASTTTAAPARELE